MPLLVTTAFYPKSSHPSRRRSAVGSQNQPCVAAAFKFPQLTVKDAVKTSLLGLSQLGFLCVVRGHWKRNTTYSGL